MEENNAYALIGLGHLHYDFKEYKDALFYWTRMLDVNPQNVDIRVLTSIGNCHRKLKTFDKGLIYFEKALEKDPDNFYALFGLADCYRGLNQQFRSIEYWNKILEQDPNKYSDEVKRMQTLLIMKGYSVGRDGADGYFGSNTYLGLYKMQRDHAKITGICDKDSWIYLEG